jgi:hypothetical protein
MQSPPRTDPPYVPIRHSAWPTRRSPRWLLLAGAVLVVGAVLVALSHKPSQSERASDLRGFVSDMNTDIESCAGGVGESLTALQGVENGSSNQVTAAVNIATYGASNCQPANSMPIDDLIQYQVTESLSSFNLSRVVDGLATWADPDAINVQADVAGVLQASTPAAKSAATAKLNQARRTLDAQRATIDAIIDHASSALSAHVTPPHLPG